MKYGGEYPKNHFSPRLKRIVFLAYVKLAVTTQCIQDLEKQHLQAPSVITEKREFHSANYPLSLSWTLSISQR